MDTNRLRQAFREPGNLIGLAASVAASAALLNPIPLLVGAVVEAAYLIFVPDTGWYGNRLAKRSSDTSQASRWERQKAIYDALPPAMQQRYARLVQIKTQIDAQAQGNTDLYGGVLQKLEYLLEQFLTFAAKSVQFQDYLFALHREVGRKQGKLTSDDEWMQVVWADLQALYARKIQEAQRLASQEPDDSSRAVLTKRVEVLQRRRDYLLEIGKTLTNLGYQLQLVEDTFGLINDEIRARPPQQMLSDIEEVVNQTDVMTKTLTEIAPYENVMAGRVA